VVRQPPPSPLGAPLMLDFCLVNHLSVCLNKLLLSTAYPSNCCNYIDQTSTILSILCPQRTLRPIIIYSITFTGFMNMCKVLYLNRNVCFEANICHTFPFFGVSGQRNVCCYRLQRNYLWSYFPGMREGTYMSLVCFLLGNSQVPEFYMPTFRNTLFHLHRQVVACRINEIKGIYEVSIAV